MADGRHFENRYIAYISEKSFDFDEILYTAADFQLYERHVIKNEQLHWTDSRVRLNVFLVTRFGRMIRPLWLNTRSTGADVAGTDKTFSNSGCNICIVASAFSCNIGTDDFPALLSVPDTPSTCLHHLEISEVQSQFNLALAVILTPH